MFWGSGWFWIGLPGIAALIAELAALIIVARVPKNYPDDPSITLHTDKHLVMGKILFTLLFGFLPAMVRPGGLLHILYILSRPFIYLGSIYFISSLFIDMMIYSILHSKEWCRSDQAVLANFPSIPLISLIVALRVYGRSKLIKRKFDIAVERGIVLGHIVRAIRRISSIRTPVSSADQIYMQSERWEVRPVPKEKPYIYVPEARSNPHICITGSSGVGKTTTVIYLIGELLRRGYPVIVFDPKGDISATAHARGWDRPTETRRRVVKIYDIGRLGADPLQPVGDETWTERVIDLINAMSVVEPVGANQKYLIQRAASEIGDKTYKSLRDKVNEYVDAFLNQSEKAPKYGPHIRDAYMGIRSKLEILSTVFREGASFDVRSLNPDLWCEGTNLAGVILNLSMIRDRYARAVTMELLLRKLELMLRGRGPLAFLDSNRRRVFIVVDEAHELARSQKWRGETTESILEDIAREARSHGAALILVTQRLSDIPDGIRMNMGLWLALRTDSPIDINILSSVMPVGRLGSIITSLSEGHALIVEAMPEKLDKMLAIASKPMAVEEGYIIRLERRLLEIKKEVEGVVREAREADLNELVKKKILLAVTQGAEGAMTGGASAAGEGQLGSNAKIAGGQERKPAEEVGKTPSLRGEWHGGSGELDDAFLERVVAHAMYMARNSPEALEVLKRLPLNVVRDFLLERGEVEVLMRYGLLRVKKDGGVVKTKAGAILKNAYRTLTEVKGGGEG